MNKYNNEQVSEHYKGMVWITKGNGLSNICIAGAREFFVIGCIPTKEITEEKIIGILEANGYTAEMLNQ